MILKIIAKENEELFFFKSNTCIMTSDRVCLEIKKIIIIILVKNIFIHLISDGFRNIVWTLLKDFRL